MPLESALQRLAGTETAYLHRGILRWSLPFLAALLPIVLLSVLSERMATRSVEQLLESRQLSLTNSVAQDITHRFLEHTTLANAVASLPGTQAALRANDRLALQSRAKAVVVAEPSIVRAVFLSESGTVVAAFPALMAKEQYAAFPWVTAAQRATLPDVSPLYLESTSKSLTVASVAPARNASGALLGIVLFEEKLEPIGAAMRSLDLPEGGSLALLDDSGQLVAHTETAPTVLRSPFPQARIADVLAGDTKSIHDSDPFTGKASAMTLVPISVGKKTWVVVASQDLEPALRDLVRLRAGLFAAGVFLTLLTLMFVVGLLRTQMHNLRLSRSLEGKNQELREVAAIVSAISDPVIGLTPEGVVRTWNPAAERLYGRTEQDIIGKPLRDILPGEKKQEFDEWLKSANAGKPVVQTETLRVSKNGVTVPVAVTLSPVKDAEGRVVAMSCVERDITAQKQIEQMKDDFISFVSHQLKAPVTATRWTIEGMLDGDYGAIPEGLKEPLNQMHDVTTKNFALISDILNASRIDRGVIELQRKPVELRVIAERAMRDYRIAAEKAGLSLTLEGGDRSIIVDADLEKVAEAITNAISNAIKHTKVGGITMRLSASDGCANIDVVDTGEGMPPDMLQKLFSRTGVKGANTQAASSSGLGLYIAKHFMELHGGDISVTSEVGKGSTFRYRLPLAPPPQQG